MAVVRKPSLRPRKVERIATHIEELKSIIRTKYPEARFEVAPVPESRWPGLWVYANIESDWDLYDLIREKEEAFFIREWMDVHVISLPLEALPAGSGSAG